MLASTKHFRESIASLRARIEDVMASVKQCADLVEPINNLIGRRDRALGAQNTLRTNPPPASSDSQEKHIAWIQSVKQQAADLRARGKEIYDFEMHPLNLPDPLPTELHQLKELCSELEEQRKKGILELAQQIAVWNQEISELQKPFQPAEVAVRGVVGELRTALDALPLEWSHLKPAREEIERLGLWTSSTKKWPLAMRSTFVDLRILGQRLDEILETLPAPPMPAIQTSGLSRPPARKWQSGPAPAMDLHRTISEVVQSHGDLWQQEASLREIVRELDRQKVPVSKAWKRWDEAPQNWKQALKIHPDRVRKAITYSLKMAARDNSRQL